MVDENRGAMKHGFYGGVEVRVIIIFMRNELSKLTVLQTEKRYVLPERTTEAD